MGVPKATDAELVLMAAYWPKPTGAILLETSWLKEPALPKLPR